MILDGGKVKSARTGHLPISQRLVTESMWDLGQEVPAGWLGRVERCEVRDVPEPVATVLAAVLGVGLSELLALTGLPPGSEAVLLVLGRVEEELGQLRDILDGLREQVQA
jgi:hypothetical protein